MGFASFLVEVVAQSRPLPPSYQNCVLIGSAPREIRLELLAAALQSGYTRLRWRARFPDAWMKCIGACGAKKQAALESPAVIRVGWKDAQSHGKDDTSMHKCMTVVAVAAVALGRVSSARAGVVMDTVTVGNQGGNLWEWNEAGLLGGSFSIGEGLMHAADRGSSASGRRTSPAWPGSVSPKFLSPLR